MPDLVMTDSEALLIAGDFSPQLTEGETVVSSNANGVSKVEVLDSSGTVQPHMVEPGSVQVVGNTVQGRIENGVPRKGYFISFFAATSGGNYLEIKVIAKVQD